MSANHTIAFAPKIIGRKKPRETILAYVRALVSDDSVRGEEPAVRVERLRRNGLFECSKVAPDDRSAASATVSILTDLLCHGWVISTDDQNNIYITRPDSIQGNAIAEKDRIRQQLHLSRDEQLRSPPTRAFVQAMERKRLYKGSFVSVFSLMRDGLELANSLRQISDTITPKNPLRKVISPYIQIADADKICEMTGFQLLDIWRYFRHTWANPYGSVPGRMMPILIRDAAVKFHPVIGIAALSSPVVQLSVRDDWIGWTSTVFIRQLQNNPTSRIARWLKTAVDKSIDEVYKTDLFENQILTPKKLENPDADTINSLEQLSRTSREKHHKLTNSNEYKSPEERSTNGDIDWEQQARRLLYSSKRAEFLARFLKFRVVLNQYFADRPTSAGLGKLLARAEGRDVVSGVLRKIKADAIGISVADISVCGALPPYNEILGGKLISMLLTSTEIINAYRSRYEKAASVIASSMAGKAIIRDPALAVLYTTSLFGITSSQYNRIKIPCRVAGGHENHCVEYIKLGKSIGFGTSQFSALTTKLLGEVLAQSENGRRINNVFGEGVSPKMRLIRNGLDELGLPSDEFLQHGSNRIVYAIPLASNFREYLLSLARRPKYYFDIKNSKQTTKRITAWWFQRWLSKRIANPDVLARMERHNFIHPIKHGARVPRVDDLNQPALFID